MRIDRTRLDRLQMISSRAAAVAASAITRMGEAQRDLWEAEERLKRAKTPSPSRMTREGEAEERALIKAAEKSVEVARRAHDDAAYALEVAQERVAASKGLESAATNFARESGR